MLFVFTSSRTCSQKPGRTCLPSLTAKRTSAHPQGRQIRHLLDTRRCGRFADCCQCRTNDRCSAIVNTKWPSPIDGMRRHTSSEIKSQHLHLNEVALDGRRGCHWRDAIASTARGGSIKLWTTPSQRHSATDTDASASQSRCTSQSCSAEVHSTSLDARSLLACLFDILKSCLRERAG
jgi:hypothetical protein